MSKPRDSVEAGHPPVRPVFVAHEEKRASSPTGGSGKKKDVVFFLKDDSGNLHKAAIGEDHGDAHYTYHNIENPLIQEYGTIASHNRGQVLQWLEMIITQSQKNVQGGPDAELAGLGERTPDNPEGLYFVTHRHVRDMLRDGRRVNKWFLVDQHHAEHLAVLGEERETRDGHYTYSAQEPFASKAPLGHCSNQTGVMHWLEQFITHVAPESEIHIGDHVKDAPPSRPPRNSKRASDRGKLGLSIAVSPRSPKRMLYPSTDGGPVRSSKRQRMPTHKAMDSLETTPRPRTSHDGGHGFPVGPADVAHHHAGKSAKGVKSRKSAHTESPYGRGASAGGAPSKHGGATPRLGGAAEASNTKRIRAFQAAAQAQASALEKEVLTEVRQHCMVVKAVQEANKRAAINWACRPTPTVDAEHIKFYLPVIVECLAEAQLLLPPGHALPTTSQMLPDAHAKTLELMEAMREVTTTYVAADLLEELQLVPLLNTCLQYPNESVKLMARSALSRWRSIALQHMLVLTEPLMTLDPEVELESTIASAQLLVPLPQAISDALRGDIPPAKLTPALPTTASSPFLNASSLPASHSNVVGSALEESEGQAGSRAAAEPATPSAAAAPGTSSAVAAADGGAAAAAKPGDNEMQSLLLNLGGEPSSSGTPLPTPKAFDKARAASDRVKAEDSNAAAAAAAAGSVPVERQQIGDNHAALAGLRVESEDARQAHHASKSLPDDATTHNNGSDAPSPSQSLATGPSGVTSDGERVPRWGPGSAVFPTLNLHRSNIMMSSDLPSMTSLPDAERSTLHFPGGPENSQDGEPSAMTGGTSAGPAGGSATGRTAPQIHAAALRWGTPEEIQRHLDALPAIEGVSVSDVRALVSAAVAALPSMPLGALPQLVGRLVPKCKEGVQALHDAVKADVVSALAQTFKEVTSAASQLREDLVLAQKLRILEVVRVGLNELDNSLQALQTFADDL